MAVLTDPDRLMRALLSPRTKHKVNAARTFCGIFQADFITVYEDWEQVLMLEGEKNDKQDGSGVLFDIVIIGDKEDGPPPRKGSRSRSSGTRSCRIFKKVSLVGTQK